MAELGFDPIFILRIALINSQRPAAFVWLDSCRAGSQRAPGGISVRMTWILTDRLG